MKIRELIEELQKCSNQDATVWIQGHMKCFEVHRIGYRWVIAEGTPYEKGDDDVRIISNDMPYD